MKKPTDNDDPSRAELMRLAGAIVAGYVSRNPVAKADLPALILGVFDTLAALARGEGGPDGRPGPAVPVKRSVMPDYIVCLEDGRKLKMLKRYLRSRYGMSPEEYRAKWNLPADYPMVAPNYAKKRSRYAKEAGFGKRKRAGKK